MRRDYKDGSGGGKGGPPALAVRHAAFREKARISGKTLGMTNMPAAKDESIEPFIKVIRGQYEGLLAEEQNRTSSSETEVAEIENRVSEERGSNLNEQINGKRNKLKTEQLEIAELDDDDGRHGNDFFVWTGIGLVAVVESMFTYKAFSMFDQGNNLSLMVVLVALIAVFIALPKMLKWWYEEYIIGSKYKWLLNALPVVTIGSGFYVLGLLRSKYLASQAAFTIDPASTGTTSGLTVSPIVFMAINVFLLMISYFLAHQLTTKGQKKNRAALDKREASIAKLEGEIERLEAELSGVPERQKNHLIRASHTNATRRDTYIQVNNYFRESVGAFMEANLAYRSDGRPKCFDTPVADLENPFA